MIAGETENMIDAQAYYPYDELFGGKGKAKRKAKRLKRKTSKTRAEKQAHKKKFFKGIGSKIKENGGLEGISSTLGNVVGMFKNDTVDQEPADYQMDVGQPTSSGQEHKKITMGMYVVGGAVVLGLVVLGVSKMGKNKA